MRDNKIYVYQKMKKLGLVLWFLGFFRIYFDGDGFGELFRWWHPLTWIWLLVMIPFCAVVGEKISWVVPLKLDGFWKEAENAEHIQFVAPWTRIDTKKNNW